MSGSGSNLRQRAIDALRAGDITTAIDLLGRVVIAYPNDAASLGLLGVLYSQQGLHNEAARALRGAAVLAPDVADHHFNLGSACERAGDRQHAVDAYCACLDREPGHARAQGRLHALGVKRPSRPLRPPASRGGSPPSAAPTAPLRTPRPVDPPPPPVSELSPFGPVFFGEGSGGAPEIEWRGNIYDLDWDMARYPGFVYGRDPDTGRPNRILDAQGCKVADIRANGNVRPIDLWHRD